MTQPPFPESLRESNPGSGPDFPGSSGDRERGKFRPSATPRLVTVAISGDDGRPIARTTEELLGDILVYQRAILLALSLTADGVGFTPEDVLTEVG